ncbi:MAG: hypothetical protein LBE48_05855 [Methanomassiliicoccaceae archaeon]|nr:hypothetical protein [Methanomassiliicoccaceae archaeon]
MEADSTRTGESDEGPFRVILNIIDNARLNAYRAVDKELMNTYWSIGEYNAKREFYNFAQHC